MTSTASRGSSLPGRPELAVVMGTVALALAPAIATQAWWFGWATLVTVAVAGLCAVGLEALCLWLRRAPVRGGVADLSALVTGLLLGLAVPPQTPVWQLAVGVLFAIAVAKHAYGGLGNNPFNPAMVGYCVMLVSFPATMGSWPAPLAAADLVTGATPLDLARHAPLAAALGLEAVAASNGSDPWPWCNGAYLLGGVVLLWRRVADAVIPATVLLGVVTGAMILTPSAPVSGVGFHLTHGAIFAGAFFIATDPVSAPATRRARAVFGFAIGMLVVVIRAHGGYPDGMAFAVLIGNAFAPLLDRLFARQ